MATIPIPVSLSGAFSIDSDAVTALGAIDVTLNFDTKLFIDPLLLQYSAQEEISKTGYEKYRRHFSNVIKLLKNTQKEDDVAWRNAKRLFRFPEASATHLGYGNSTRGSGWGPALINSTLKTAAEVVRMGIDDVDLFMVLALFEEGIGSDRISDMTTSIIRDELAEFTIRVCSQLNTPLQHCVIEGTQYRLPISPVDDTPILLVPRDIVRKLPIALDWSDISRVVDHNQILRDQVNNQVGQIWARMTKKEKAERKKKALENPEAFKALLSAIKSVPPEPYDIKADNEGEFFWRDYVRTIAEAHPLATALPTNTQDIDSVESIVATIVQQFKFLIEDRGLWREMWSEDGKKNRKEKAAQRLFLAVAYSYCAANRLDLSPEADSGSGPVDFKVSDGGDKKVLVEIKLSTGTVVHGYETQLEIYKSAEETDRGIFIVIDIGRIGRKLNDIEKIRSSFIEERGCASKIVYIDANQRASASKR